MSPLCRLLILVLTLALPTLLPTTVSAGNGAGSEVSEHVKTTQKKHTILGKLWSFGPRNRKRDSGLVYLMTYQEAMDVAYRVVDDAFGDDTLYISNDETWIGVTRYRSGRSRGNLDRVSGETQLEREMIRTLRAERETMRRRDPRQRSFSVVISPRIVANRDDPEAYGIVFGLEAYRDYSISRVRRLFYDQLDEYLEDTPIETTTFTSFRMTEDTGWADLAPDNIPTTYTGFQRYVDNRKALHEFEGIWETQDGRYTLGIYYRPNDPRYKYHAAVIKTRNPRWKPGQVKGKFSRLSKNKPTPGVFLTESKTEFGIIAVPEGELITIGSGNAKTLLLKVYPIHNETMDRFNGMGTGWAVDRRGTFITNAHVIRDAEKIFVGHRDADPIRARVLIVDEQNDLAVLRLKSKGPDVTPLPLSGRGKIPNGTDVVAIGFPLAFELGDSPRITEGVIAAQNGYQKDITRYQMTATIDHGNSGGPVVDSHGNVAGVSVEMLQTGNVSHSFAVKVNYVRSLLEQVEVDFTLGEDNETLSPEVIFERYQGSVLPVWTE